MALKRCVLNLDLKGSSEFIRRRLSDRSFHIATYPSIAPVFLTIQAKRRNKQHNLAYS